MAKDMPGGFRVDLATLSAAITSVSSERTNVTDSLEEIRLKMNGLSASWNSPSYQSFEEVSEWFDSASTKVESLLDDLITRMRTSHDNYSSAEGASTDNLTT